MDPCGIPFKILAQSLLQLFLKLAYIIQYIQFSINISTDKNNENVWQARAMVKGSKPTPRYPS